ncbi:DNA translocase FtsK [Rhizobium sp. BK251]|uniref:DNA translocase FtsK n=1 Tax=Rhizobium sp. BK251 TaxID=2512125 RepID=UPI00104F3763|nr:DNA translocase FtsK [Rhizobium sp. BK251]TCL71948.1 DNA translocase FtsK [Rhizobium sp. BK251]
MRFPRTNFNTDSADLPEGFEPDRPLTGNGEPLLDPFADPAAPAWQRAFALAPNVRFTRTPQSQIAMRRGADHDAADAAAAGSVHQDSVSPKSNVEPTVAQVAVTSPPTNTQQAAAKGPFDARRMDAQAPLARPAPRSDDRRLIVKRAQPKTEVAPPVAVMPQPLPTETLPRVHMPITTSNTSPFAGLSDFAFWEGASLDVGTVETAPQPSMVVKPLPAVSQRREQVVVRPSVEIAPDSIASRFRIVECRAQARPSQNVAMPVQPVAAPVARDPGAAASTPVQAKPAVVELPPAILEVEKSEQATPPEPAVRQQQEQLRRDIALPRQSVQRVAPPQRVVPEYEFPPRELLQEPVERLGEIMSQETLEQNAGLLESVLEDFGVKGEIIHVRPGPVVTLYEFEPAPGVKSSRVIGLADDIARSMSALSARVAVVPGRNVIGIELPNATRETVYFREMIESGDFAKSSYKLALGLGKTIGGEPVIAELAKMPHLLVAGTTGSGKSVAINTMILSLLYRLTPEECRLIMVDPKMLELSVYDGIPHLLTPVVTDPKKAVMALKWAVREMEDRYRKMSRLGVRNIDGYNSRVAIAREKGETIHVMVQTGFEKGTGIPIEESQELDLTPMPYIVVIVDEMADLMMVAGKEIEGAIQRLAQMARAAGIHLIMATQRPSVDVITGTIKANFPTRISFQVTSKIDSRTILGEQGAEQLLGQGDMLHMQGGGRIARVHGPFVSDHEVEKVVAHLKTQGRPEYLETVTADEDEDEEAEEGGAVFDKSAMGAEDGDDLYEKAVKVVMRDKKCSTSYIQRRLGIGYNRAASLVERMEKEGLVGPANHVGKREIVSGRTED